MIQIILVLFALFILSTIRVYEEEEERERIRKNITSKSVL